MGSSVNRTYNCPRRMRGLSSVSQEIDCEKLLCRGGRLMLTILSFPYATAVGGRHAGKRCLHMLAQQPGPMGGEVCELIRERDPESPLLR